MTRWCGDAVMGWPTREVALREMAKEHQERLTPLRRAIHGGLMTRLAHSVPNRLAGVEINEDGDAI